MSDEYLTKSLDKFQQEATHQIEQGSAKIFEPIPTEFLSQKIRMNHVAFIKLFYTVSRHLANNEDITFTAEEIKEICEKHKTKEVSGIQLPVAGENTTTLKDHIVLVMQQFSAIRTSEKSNNPGEAIIPKYIQNCQKELYENVPSLKTYVDSAVEAHKTKVKEVRLDL